MPLTVENRPVAVGDVLLFQKHDCKSWTRGNVVDINEHVKAVKLAISYAKSIKYEWFAASVLRRTEPKDESKPF